VSTGGAASTVIVWVWESERLPAASASQVTSVWVPLAVMLTGLPVWPAPPSTVQNTSATPEPGAASVPVIVSE
jgi:hypothetical protein